MAVEVSSFGELKGKEAKLFTLRNNAGTTVKITTYGARITELHVPDRRNISDNIVLGFDSLAQYLAGEPYFGCVVGRVANRIAKGQFELNCVAYNLAVNNGPNCLHGGKVGFDKVIWESRTSESDRVGSSRIDFTYLSRDGEENFPGDLSARASYTLAEDNSLTLEFHATTDKTTIVNFTNHSYFNLDGAGSGTILEHNLMLNADAYTPTDDTLIPTGELRAVKGTPFDFTKAERIGARIGSVSGGGYDHNYVLNGRGPAARLESSKSGRVMEVYTSQPGIQLYTSNFLDGSLKGLGGKYEKHGAVCLETQHFPDSIHHPNFPSTVLQPGEVYGHTVKYVFSTM